MISCETFKQKHSLEIMSAVEFIFRKAGEVSNFTKDRLRILIPLGIWKIFRTDISCTPAASYFYYYVMPRSFLLDRRVFSLYLFRWRHWEISSQRLFNKIIYYFHFFVQTQTTSSWIGVVWFIDLYSRISVGEVSYLLVSSIQ